MNIYSNSISPQTRKKQNAFQKINVIDKMVHIIAYSAVKEKERDQVIDRRNSRYQ